MNTVTAILIGIIIGLILGYFIASKLSNITNINTKRNRLKIKDSKVTGNRLRDMFKRRR